MIRLNFFLILNTRHRSISTSVYTARRVKNPRRLTASLCSGFRLLETVLFVELYVDAERVCIVTTSSIRESKLPCIV